MRLFFMLCLTTAVWAQAPFQGAIQDLKPTGAGQSLTIEAGRCWGTARPASTATVQSGNGNGRFVAYCTDTQTIVVEYAKSAGIKVNCQNCVASEVLEPAIPEGMYRIAEGSIAGGKFEGVEDLRDITRGHRHVNGAGMNVQCKGGTCIDQVDTAIVQLKTDSYAPVGEVDNSGSTGTRPFRMGAALGSKCKVGEFFYQTSAAPGRRLHECVETNKWARAWPEAGPPEKVATQWHPATVLASHPNYMWTQARLDPVSTATNPAAPLPALSYLTTTLPQDWSGGMDARVFAQAATGKNRGTVEVAASCAGPGSQEDGFNRAVAAVPGPAKGGITAFTAAGLDMTGCSAGDLVMLELRQNGEMLQLVGIELTLRSR